MATYVAATASSTDQTGTSITTTLPSHSAGDLIIGWVDSPDVVPNLPSGWTNLSQTGFTRAFWRIAPDTSTSSAITFPTSTSAPAWAYAAYRGVADVAVAGTALPTTAFTDNAAAVVVHLIEGDGASTINAASGTTQRAVDRRSLPANVGIFEDNNFFGSVPSRTFNTVNSAVTLKLFPPALFVGGTNSTTDQTGTSITTTLPAHNTGDVIVGWVDSPDTVPQLPSGWTALAQTGFTRAFYRVAPDTSTSSAITFPTSTSAPAWCYAAYRNVGSVTFDSEGTGAITAGFTDNTMIGVLHLVEGDGGTVIGPASSTYTRAADRRSLGANAGIFENGTTTGTIGGRNFGTANRWVNLKLMPVAAPVLNATAALATTSTLTATGVRAAAASRGLTTVSTLTAIGVAERTASHGLTATSTLTAIVSGPTVSGAATLVAASTLTVTAVRAQPASTALVSTSVLTGTASSGAVTRDATAALATVSTLTADADRTQHLYPRMMILTKIVPQAPTSVIVVVDGGWPSDIVRFTVDGITVMNKTLDSVGGLGQTSIPVPEALGAAGVHTLMMESIFRELTYTMSDTFTVSLPPAPAPVAPPADAPVVVVPEAATPTGVYRWVFQDRMPGGLGTYVFPNNPTSMSNPHVKKMLAQTHTTAVDTGQYHMTEVAEFAINWSFQGVCLSQAHYDILDQFAKLKRRFYIIDHRNRAWTVAGVSFDPQARLRTNLNGTLTDWVHDYTFNAIIMDPNWVVPT